MKFLTALTIILLCATPSLAQSEGSKGNVFAKAAYHLGHYVAHHKQLLVSDALVFAAWNDTAAASQHAANVGAPVNLGLWGPTTSPARAYGTANLTALCMAATDHALWHLVPSYRGGRKTSDPSGVWVATGLWSAIGLKLASNAYGDVNGCKAAGGCK